jgi:hypothetical protein
MSESIKNVVLLSASPKVNQAMAVSELISKRGDAKLKSEQIGAMVINVRNAIIHHETAPAFDFLQNADAIILIFPLYFFCLPGMLTRFLQDFASKEPKAKKDCAVFAIVNCGFPEPENNLEAISVVEQFALQTGRIFGGGVMIGGGGMLIGTKGKPFISPIMNEIDREFSSVIRYIKDSGSLETKISVAAPKFPRKLYLFAGNAGWRSTARENKLKSNDLYRTPYES